MNDKNGMPIMRKESVETKTGFIFYTTDGTDWWIDYPNGSKRYGKVTPEQLCVFFKALYNGKTIDEADNLSGR